MTCVNSYHASHTMYCELVWQSHESLILACNLVRINRGAKPSDSEQMVVHIDLFLCNDQTISQELGNLLLSKLRLVKKRTHIYDFGTSYDHFTNVLSLILLL